MTARKQKPRVGTMERDLIDSGCMDDWDEASRLSILVSSGAGNRATRLKHRRLVKRVSAKLARARARRGER